jgi:sugar lactone lactonase YvrE
MRAFLATDPRRSILVAQMSTLIALLLLSALAIPSAGASSHVETLAQFDAAAGELPEGVTVDKAGNVFVSLSPLGELVKFRPGSTSPEPFGAVPGLMPGDFGLLGLAVDAPGNVYGGVISANPDARGVWKFDRKTGAGERFAGTEAIILPNAVAFDDRGTLYATDTIGGAVWRIPKGGAAELWIADPLLAGDGSVGFGFPIGANGIAVRHNTVYVGVSEKATIVTIPILPDGAAGQIQVERHLPGVAIDGIALDVHGNIYIANVLSSSIVRANTDGSVETLATAADGLDAPSSLAFGTGKGDRQSLYVVNFSVALLPPGGAGPALLRVAVDEPGQPQP